MHKRSCVLWPNWRLVIFLLILIGAINVAPAQICAIGNSRLAVRSLTRIEVANIYQGRAVHGRRWRPIDLPANSTTFKFFYHHVLGWDASDVSAFWSQQVFGGGSSQPQQADSSSEAIAMVRSSVQSIAYVPMNGSMAGVRLLYCFGHVSHSPIYHAPHVSVTHHQGVTHSNLVNHSGQHRSNLVNHSGQHRSNKAHVPDTHRQLHAGHLQHHVLPQSAVGSHALVHQGNHSLVYQDQHSHAQSIVDKKIMTMPAVDASVIAKVTDHSSVPSSNWLSRLRSWWGDRFSSTSAQDNTVPSETRNMKKNTDPAADVPLVINHTATVNQLALDQAASVAHHLGSSIAPVHHSLSSAVSVGNVGNNAGTNIPLKLSNEASNSADLFTLPKANISTQVDKSKFANSLWPVLIQHFSLGNYLDNPRVKVEINWFLQHKKLLSVDLKNAVLYLYYVFEQTQKRNMPAEFALLPIIESNYDPYAYSRVGATGLWQLMPGTAMSHALDISWWYDGRMDVETSTQSALDYIKHYGRAFNDWKLATASYNAGPGVVSKARRYAKSRGLPTDFWHLSLPKETMRYVPKLLALSYIVAHADQYGIKLPVIANSPYFTSIKMTSQIELVKAARLAGISAKLMRLLNPGFRRFATTPNSHYSLLIPVDHAKTFRRNLGSIAGQEQRTWIYHEARQGETLIKVAADYHTSVALLKQVNGLTTTVLNQDQGVLVPLSLHRHYAAALAPSKKTVNWVGEQVLPVAKQLSVTVQLGQTLLSIATKYDVTVNQLMVWNQLDKSTQVKPGDRLIIWLVGEDDSTPFGSQKISLSSDQRLDDALNKIYKSE